MLNWLDDWWVTILEGERQQREAQFGLNAQSLPLLAAMSRTPMVLNWRRGRLDFMVKHGCVFGLKVYDESRTAR